MTRLQCSWRPPRRHRQRHDRNHRCPIRSLRPLHRRSRQHRSAWISVSHQLPALMICSDSALKAARRTRLPAPPCRRTVRPPLQPRTRTIPSRCLAQPPPLARRRHRYAMTPPCWLRTSRRRVRFQRLPIRLRRHRLQRHLQSPATLMGQRGRALSYHGRSRRCHPRRQFSPRLPTAANVWCPTLQPRRVCRSVSNRLLKRRLRRPLNRLRRRRQRQPASTQRQTNCSPPSSVVWVFRCSCPKA